ncbi:hypothetical protein [Sphingopyxis macrogoltabida]|uniref:hypothetical protein n=1 Tax=Sphingopyxis macrogoltabida TaxID=33050 RepID=UPI001F3C1526|nr:hypothetical protein [Sphingopyxis macrogoltabida]
MGIDFAQDEHLRRREAGRHGELAAATFGRPQDTPKRFQGGICNLGFHPDLLAAQRARTTQYFNINPFYYISVYEVYLVARVERLDVCPIFFVSTRRVAMCSPQIIFQEMNNI